MHLRWDWAHLSFLNVMVSVSTLCNWVMNYLAGCGSAPLLLLWHHTVVDDFQLENKCSVVHGCFWLVEPHVRSTQKRCQPGSRPSKIPELESRIKSMSWPGLLPKWLLERGLWGHQFDIFAAILRLVTAVYCCFSAKGAVTVTRTFFFLGLCHPTDL